MAMASLHFIFISTVILTFGIQMGSAIKCVECNSHYEKWCEDIPADFNYTKHASNKYNEYLTDCDTKDGGSVDGLSYTMCRTMSQKVGSDASRTIRMCAAHGKADKCYERTGTKNIKLSYCTCEGDWCNSAPTLLGPRLIILSTISVILALISFL